MLICVIVPRNSRRTFLAGFLTGLYGQSHRCDRVRVGRSGIYTYTDFAIEIWGFYRRLNDTLRYHHTRCSRDFCAAGSHFKACLPTEEKLSLLRVVRCFWRVLENSDCRTKFNSSVGMEYNGELYGFSAVKVKFVDSLI